MKGYPACLSIVRFSNSHIPDTNFHIPFLRLKAVFLRLDVSRGTTTAAEIGQAVVDLKLEVK